MLARRRPGVIGSKWGMWNRERCACIYRGAANLQKREVVNQRVVNAVSGTDSGLSIPKNVPGEADPRD